MATIADMNKRWQALDIESEVIQTVNDNKELMLQLNKDQLLDEGFDKKGAKLKRYQSDAYARRKNRLNPFPGLGNPDLYLTGAFFRGFRLNLLTKKEFEITSTDSKTKDLVSKYGKDIFGLGTDKKSELIEGGFRSDLVQRVREAVKL